MRWCSRHIYKKIFLFFLSKNLYQNNSTLYISLSPLYYTHMYMSIEYIYIYSCADVYNIIWIDLVRRRHAIAIRRREKNSTIAVYNFFSSCCFYIILLLCVFAHAALGDWGGGRMYNAFRCIVFFRIQIIKMHPPCNQVQWLALLCLVIGFSTVQRGARAGGSSSNGGGGGGLFGCSGGWVVCERACARDILCGCCVNFFFCFFFCFFWADGLPLNTYTYVFCDVRCTIVGSWLYIFVYTQRKNFSKYKIYVLFLF